MGRGFLAFLAIFQSVLLAAHVLALETWLHFWGIPSAKALLAAKLGAMLLAVSFVIASLLSFRYWNAFTRSFYRLAAAWLGIVNFLFFAAIAVWLTAGLKFAGRFAWRDKTIVSVWFGIALAAATWGIINASLTRVNRITVRLPNLPKAWRGRKAAMISDLHLGHV